MAAAEYSPPMYTTGNDCPPVLLNLAPLVGSVTFQRGQLGHTPASVEGEVQIKYIGPADAERPLYSKLEVVFRGVEKSAGVEIELVEQKRVLWGEGQNPVSEDQEEQDEEEQRSRAGPSGPPSSMRFKMDLTPDLPHCIHLGPSSLEYTLTATLHFVNPTIAPIMKTAPVHLVRTSPPGSLLSGSTLVATADPPPSITPQTMDLSDPISLSVRLQRTVFRRAEPVELMVRIEVPSEKTVREQGLRLRTVSAELVRKVTVVDAQGNEVAEADASAAPPRPPLRNLSDDDDAPPLPPPPLVAEPHITVLARSGKSARFSPTRPIVIRLLLHPPASISCESISQSTILHSITFSIRLTVGLFAQHDSSRHDVTLSRTIFIVPDTPSHRSEKQREVESDAETSPGWMPAEGPVPTYHESAEGSGSWGNEPSGSVPSTPNGLAETGATGPEEEYDGYEEISVSLSSRAPPPTIDEDVSPPSASAEGIEAPPNHLLLELEDPDNLETLPPPPHELASSSTSSSSHTASPHLSLPDDGPGTPPEESLPPPYVVPGSPTSPSQAGPAVLTGPPPYTSHHAGMMELVGVTANGDVVIEQRQ